MSQTLEPHTVVSTKSERTTTNPQKENNKPRAIWGFTKRNYYDGHHGKNSEGNRFIRNDDL